MEVVAHLYDGRLGALMEAGRTWTAPGAGFVGRAVRDAMERHIALHFGRLASGAATTSRYSRGLIRFLGRHGLRGVDPAGFAIR
jgi:hypothetical protein